MYRVVALNNGKYWFQTGVLKVKQEVDDEEDEAGEESEPDAPSEPPVKAAKGAKGAKGGKKRAASPVEEAAAVAVPLSTKVPPVGGKGSRIRNPSRLG